MSEKSNEKQSDKPKAKSYTEDEFRAAVTQAVREARDEAFTYQIKHTLDHYGRKIVPDHSIEMRGGNLALVHALAIQLEEIIIAFAKSNPPKIVITEGAQS